MKFLKISLLLAVLVLDQQCALTQTNLEENNETKRYLIEGRIKSLNQTNWESQTQIHVNGEEFIGFLQKKGSFVIHNVPSGSYIVEILNPEYTFEPILVEINSKGKYRARIARICVDRDPRVTSNKQSSEVKCQVPYPLRIKAIKKTEYFQKRDQWKIKDIILNPMVLMMVLPVILVVLLPMLNDPESKKQVEQFQSRPNFDLGEYTSNFLTGLTHSGDTQKQQQKNNNKTKKRQ